MEEKEEDDETEKKKQRILSKFILNLKLASFAPKIFGHPKKDRFLTIKLLIRTVKWFTLSAYSYIFYSVTTFFAKPLLSPIPISTIPPTFQHLFRT